MANKDYPYLEIPEEELIRAKREEERNPYLSLSRKEAYSWWQIEPRTLASRTKPMSYGIFDFLWNQCPNFYHIKMGNGFTVSIGIFAYKCGPIDSSRGGTGRIRSITPTACYPPEPDFYVRSSKYPGRVLRSPQDFVELRKNHTPSPVTQQAWQNHKLFNKTNAYQADQVAV